VPRKPLSDEERRDRHISVWLTDAEYQDIARAAEADEDPPSTWVRKRILRVARELQPPRRGKGGR